MFKKMLAAGARQNDINLLKYYLCHPDKIDKIRKIKVLWLAESRSSKNEDQVGLFLRSSAHKASG